jgi:hypothetical protein
MSNREQELFSCVCGNINHVLAISSWPEEQELYVSVKLHDGNLWYRLKQAWTYIVSPYINNRCECADIILSPAEAEHMLVCIKQRTEELKEWKENSSAFKGKSASS